MVSNEILTMQEVADRIRGALDASDLDGFTGILDPEVTWEAADDPTPICSDRRQVLGWYQRRRDAGVRWHVTAMIVGTNGLLVGLRITREDAAEDPAGATEHWQALSIRGGRVYDIRGYATREEAAARAGAL